MQKYFLYFKGNNFLKLLIYKQSELDNFRREERAGYIYIYIYIPIWNDRLFQDSILIISHCVYRMDTKVFSGPLLVS